MYNRNLKSKIVDESERDNDIYISTTEGLEEIYTKERRRYTQIVPAARTIYTRARSLVLARERATTALPAREWSVERKRASDIHTRRHTALACPVQVSLPRLCTLASRATRWTACIRIAGSHAHTEARKKKKKHVCEKKR